jgi:hypothetical protein
MARTMAARSGAPPASSTPATPEAAAAAPSIYGRRVGAADRRPGIRRGTWSPALLRPLTIGHRPAAQAGEQGRRDNTKKGRGESRAAGRIKHRQIRR